MFTLVNPYIPAVGARMKWNELSGFWKAHIPEATLQTEKMTCLVRVCFMKGNLIRALWSDLARFGLYALVLRKKQDSLDESAKSGRKQSKVRNHKRISLVYCATVLAFFLKWKEGYSRRLCVTFEYRKKWKKKVKKKKKTASSPEQDLHPDWDRFRGTMLYPLSCGELAMSKE